MKLIGITGKAGSGKTTLSEVLVENGYTKRSFAEEIKWIGRRYAKIPPEQKGEKERIFYQGLGDLLRGYNPMLLVDRMNVVLEWYFAEESYKNRRYKAEHKIVIDDVRFSKHCGEAEADLVRSLGGIMIHLDGGYDLGELGNHSTEKPLTRKKDDIILSYQRFNSKDLFKEVVTEDLVRLGFINAN